MTEMEERKKYVRGYCANTSITIEAYAYNFSQVQEKYYKDEQAGISYCKVPKAGSSMWTQIFLTFQAYHRPAKSMTVQQNIIQRIFNKTRGRLHGSRPFSSKTPPSANYTSVNVITVRNPYSRLFSAYVDKILLLDKIHVSRRISLMYGKSPALCGFNVTFQEFLDYVYSRAANGSKINRHWSPIYLLCRPCDVTYDVVSKIETLSNDMNYILNLSRVSNAAKEILQATLRSHTNSYGILNAYILQWKKHREKCPYLKDYMIKIWQALQFQGEVSTDLPLPMNEFDTILTNDPDINDVTGVLHRYVTQHQQTSKRRKIQRRKALVDAYKNISNSTIAKIQELFKLDFLLFQYDFSPPS